MGADSEVLVRVEGVRKKFCRSLKRSLWYGMKDLAAEAIGRNSAADQLREGEFWAVDNVSFELRRGECLGLIGRNGAGKTTLLKMLNGLIKPDGGRIEMRGRVGALIALGAGFNPILTGRENVYVNGAVLGWSRSEIEAKLPGIIEFAGIGEFIESPVQTYSSGMLVRLGYAVAASLRPELLLVDEVLAVGDAAFQRKCMDSMRAYVKDGGSIILVAHNMHAIQSLCGKCVLLHQGGLHYAGPTNESVREYFTLQEQPNPALPETRVSAPEHAPSSVSITTVSITGADGGPPRTGRPATVRLAYVSAEKMPAVAWGISFWTNDLSLRIATANCMWDGAVARLVPGIGELTCSIPNLPLTANRYCLKAGIYDAEHSWPIALFGWEDSPLSFAVEAPAVESHNRRLIGGDLVIMDVLWQQN